MRLTTLVFPAPVAPTRATFSPGRTRKETPLSTQSFSVGSTPLGV